MSCGASSTRRLHKCWRLLKVQLFEGVVDVLEAEHVACSSLSTQDRMLAIQAIRHLYLIPPSLCTPLNSDCSSRDPGTPISPENPINGAPHLRAQDRPHQVHDQAPHDTNSSWSRQSGGLQAVQDPAPSQWSLHGWPDSIAPGARPSRACVSVRPRQCIMKLAKVAQDRCTPVRTEQTPRPRRNSPSHLGLRAHGSFPAVYSHGSSRAGMCPRPQPRLTH